MKKFFSLAAASVLLLASFSSCQFSDSAEDTFVSIVCTTAQASGVTCFIAKLNGSLTVESEKQLSQSVSFLYSDSARTVEELKASGKKVPAELTEDGSFTSALSKLGSNTTYFYVACAEVSEKEYYGEVKSFKTVDLHLEAVDMGLSVKWASSNLGAAKPEDYGDYYAWGEIEPKDYYGWNTYKWCDDSKLFDKLTKYNNMSDYGTVDNKTRLDLDTDDVARVLLGEKWRMPEEEDFNSLIANCTWKWTQMNGVNGYLATSKKNGASIFLPAAGYRRYGELENAGSHGYYWSATLFLNLPEYARCLDLTSDDFFVNHKNRFFGFPIRPVQIN